jgi:ribokinase
MGILVAGSLHFDVVVRTPRLPGNDETLMGDAVDYVFGGKGGNQAVAAARMDARVFMAGKVGDDQFAPVLLANLADAGIDTSLLQHGKGERSGMSVALVDRSGDYGAVVVSGANRTIDSGRIAVPADTRIVLLQNEIPETVNGHVASLARQKRMKVILNAAPMRSMSGGFLALVDILIVNRVEAEGLFGHSCRTVAEAMRLAEGATGFQAIIVTLGEAGAVLKEAGQAPVHFPAQKVDVFSTHGAGDMFAGVLAARLDAGDAIVDALPFAQAAAALLVSTTLAERDGINPAAVRALMERQ